MDKQTAIEFAQAVVRKEAASILNADTNVYPGIMVCNTTFYSFPDSKTAKYF